MLTPNGVYMINIIDVYETDEHAEDAAQKKIEEDEITDAGRAGRRFATESLAKARDYGGFLGPGPRPPGSRFPTSTSSAPTASPGWACAKRSWSSPR